MQWDCHHPVKSGVHVVEVEKVGRWQTEDGRWWQDFAAAEGLQLHIRQPDFQNLQSIGILLGLLSVR